MAPKRYRIWDTKHKRMILPDEIAYSGADYSENRYIKLYSTNTRDKNGVEIFEGDVVALTEFEDRGQSFAEYYGTVEFLDGRFIIRDAIFSFCELEFYYTDRDRELRRKEAVIFRNIYEKRDEKKND